MKVGYPSGSSSRNAIAPTSDDEGGLQLGQVVAVLRRKALLILGITTAVALLAQFKAHTEKPIYSAGFEILTQSVTVESEVISSVPQTLSNRQQNTDTSTQILDETKIQVLRSPTLLMPLLEQLKPRYPDLTYEALVQDLRIATSQPDILAVSFRNEESAFVEDVLRLLSEQYLNYSLEERQRDIRQGIVFVEEQLPKLSALVSKQQVKLQQFRQQYNIIDPELQAQQLSDQAGELSQTRLTTQTQLSEARLLYSEVQNELRANLIEDASASALSDNPRYQKLLDQLLVIDSQLAQDSALYLEESPELEVVQEQRRNLIPLLQREGVRVQREVVSQIKELENRNQAVDQSIAILNQQVKQLSLITREYTDIQRELQIATDNLNQFLAKREGLRIDAAQRQVPWQLLTPPGQPIPGAASTKQRLVLSLGFGLLLGLGVALLSDRLSDLIHTSKEIKDITKLPLLGAIPLNRDLDAPTHRLGIAAPAPVPPSGGSTSGDGFPAWVQSSPFQEAFRTLYANLRFISPDAPIRTLVVTSPTPGNGKTTIASYLAQAAAAAGRRVLLVDADLRHPRLHHYLGKAAKYGLTDVVSSELDFQAVVCPVAWEENLFILPSGSPPPDPTRILASQSMQQFMAKASEAFDLVIYDTPPLLGFADAYFLAPYTDGMLLIVRLNQLKRVFLEQTVEELRVSAAPVLGAVANATEETTISSYSYYQYYSDSQPSAMSLWRSKLAQVRPSKLWRKSHRQ